MAEFTPVEHPLGGNTDLARCSLCNGMGRSRWSAARSEYVFRHFSFCAESPDALVLEGADIPETVRSVVGRVFPPARVAVIPRGEKPWVHVRVWKGDGVETVPSTPLRLKRREYRRLFGWPLSR